MCAGLLDFVVYNEEEAALSAKVNSVTKCCKLLKLQFDNAIELAYHLFDCTINLHILLLLLTKIYFFACCLVISCLFVIFFVASRILYMPATYIIDNSAYFSRTS